MRKLLRFWFTFDIPVDRSTYLVHGLALMAVKITVDVALVRLVTGFWWSPVDYARMIRAFTELEAAGAPRWLGFAMLAWMLPFVAIGAMLTLRRALDAGISPWFTAFFFVPVANYVLMLVLSVLPTSRVDRDRGVPHVQSKMSSAVGAIAASAIAGLAVVLFAIFVANDYGGTLFVGTPFVMGATAAYWFNLRYPASASDTRRVVMATFVAASGAIVLLAIEGAICLAMAFPLALGAGYLAAPVGRRLAQLRGRSSGEAMIALLALPLAMSPSTRNDRVHLHEVRSAIVIDAPPAVVWMNVVAFPPLAEPTELIFRAGISYPMGARIEGNGVGALRYCEFSTGAFVEPVTAWEPGRRLAFDVTSQPPPLREWSPYRIAPPHLDGYFGARRGEFRLEALTDGRTRLEGSTWYDLDVAPRFYWSWFADALVSRIHMRVLRHIKAVSESAAH